MGLKIIGSSFFVYVMIWLKVLNFIREKLVVILMSVIIVLLLALMVSVSLCQYYRGLVRENDIVAEEIENQISNSKKQQWDYLRRIDL